jgi:hypothetical protein
VDEGRPASRLLSGWSTALRWALTTVGVAGLLAELMAFLVYLAGRSQAGTGSAGVAARVGGLLFFAFHHVGLVFDVPRFRPFQAAGLPGASLAVPATLTLAVAPLAGTLLVAWLLVRAGHRLGDAGGGPAWARGLHGLKVAPLYAAACVGLSYLVRLGVTPPANQFVSGQLHVHPDHLHALVWPLALSAAFGFLGGLRSAPGRERTGLVRAAVSGAGWMVGTGLVLAFGGLLVLGVVEPGATEAYFREAFSGGTLRGVEVLTLTALVVPNMAAWVLFPAMGACVGVFAESSTCLLSYTRFPAGAGSGVTGPVAGAGLASHGPPAGFFVFLLVPLIAVLAGGFMAARRAGSSGAGSSALAGALAGVAFGPFGLLTAVLAGITVTIGGISGQGAASGTIRVGPDLITGTLQALVWGIGGGALGGLLTLLRRDAGPAQAGRPPPAPT